MCILTRKNMELEEKTKQMCLLTRKNTELEEKTTKQSQRLIRVEAELKTTKQQAIDQLQTQQVCDLRHLKTIVASRFYKCTDWICWIFYIYFMYCIFCYVLIFWWLVWKFIWALMSVCVNAVVDSIN